MPSTESTNVHSQTADHPADHADHDFDCLIGIIALPRSGTTVVTAVLDVHSAVHAVYEPWNAHQESVDSLQPMNFDDFHTRFVSPAGGRRYLLVKETATRPSYLDRMSDLMSQSPVPRRELVVILRNPFHVFLSEVQARREWWGAADLEINVDSFSRWAQRTLDGVRRLAEMAARHDALLLSYEQFSASPAEGVAALTRAIGLTPEDRQLEFEKHLDRSRVRGDNNVSQAPQPVSRQSVVQREGELVSMRERFMFAPEYPAISALGRALATLPLLSRASEQAAVLAEMGK